MKHVFLILHYNTLDDTYACVESIKGLDNQKNIKIVIVDNCSPNKSGQELLKEYKKDKQVEVILSEKNLGFANGNNLGFKYAKDNYDPDFITMCNSDTIIYNKDYCKILENDYLKYNYSVLGPKIKLPDNSFAGFICDGTPDIKFINRNIMDLRIHYFKTLFHLDKFHLRNIKRRIFKKRYTQIGKDNNKKLNNIQKNVTLNGCFMVFSKNYISKFDGIDNRTFMYGEEILLQLRLAEHNMLSLYDPKIRIFHKCGSSTKTNHKNRFRKIKFEVTETLKSLTIAKNDLKKKRR